VSEQAQARNPGGASRDGEGHRPRRHPTVVWESLGSEVTLFRPGSDEAHILNPSASVIWQGCDGGRRVEDLIEVVVAQYGIDHERAVADVVGCLARFRSLGLLADDEAGEPPDLDA
jgi:hypothetical protein